MSNIFDYLGWRGDLSFSQSPFNEVDNLILCYLSNVDFSGIISEQGSPITIATAAKEYFSKHSVKERLGVFCPPQVLPMFKRLSVTARFRGLLLGDYINKVDLEREEQFSALTIGLLEGTQLVIFRGTDDTLVAWKENFNMGACDVIPAQTDAATYLLRAAQKSAGPIRCGGHSKGGNLAVYASLHSPPEVQERIINIYNNDGPGFRESILDTPEYRRIRAKVMTLVPQYSLVGRLLCHEETYKIVKSEAAGIGAHNGFTWLIRGPRFVRSKDFALRSKLFDSAFKNWVKDVDLEKRRRFVDALFGVLTSSGAVTLTDLNEHKLLQTAKIAKNLRQEPEVRELIVETLKLLVKEYAKSAHKALPTAKKRIKGTTNAQISN